MFQAMDIYLGACFIFAFMSMAKLAVVKYMTKRVKKRDKNLLLQDLERSLGDSAGSISIDLTRRKLTTTISGRNMTDRNGAHDRYWVAMKVFHIGSQLVLPLAFAAFALFYFFIYPHVVSNYGTCFPSEK